MEIAFINKHGSETCFRLQFCYFGGQQSCCFQGTHLPYRKEGEEDGTYRLGIHVCFYSMHCPMFQSVCYSPSHPVCSVGFYWLLYEDWLGIFPHSFLIGLWKACGWGGFFHFSCTEFSRLRIWLGMWLCRLSG